MINQDILKEFLSYDKVTGEFTRLKTAGGKLVGSKVGTVTKRGYLYIRVAGKRIMAHRLAWLYEYGEFPEYIDHINGDLLNNKIDNLRNVSHADNMKNKKQYKNNTVGTVGVHWHKRMNKWQSHIRVDGKQLSLGTFDNFEDALMARQNAEYKYSFHTNHGRVY